ncbi:sporulation membrane protein YtrI [Pseudalkalibacillus decolorationis]|uniref:sporulation membrane protein YtrI n=1 Tax=Pseudalkalibacillus decolorationis TaxID=163879 RepID=UPI0021473B37|nr:sporulation membrane protein YtrI [Pseudalkalibacillus decolorationis]
MRIPPLHRRKGYQRFFAGIVIGFILGWFFFLLSFGGLQEFYLTKIEERDARISELKDKNEHFEAEYDEKNKEIKKNLTVQEIDVIILNKDKVELKGLTLLDLKNSITQELHDVLAKDIESVAQNSQLLVRALENKTFLIDKDKFEVKVVQMHLYTTLRLTLNVERVK